MQVGAQMSRKIIGNMSGHLIDPVLDARAAKLAHRALANDPGDLQTIVVRREDQSEVAAADEEAHRVCDALDRYFTYSRGGTRTLASHDVVRENAS